MLKNYQKQPFGWKILKFRPFILDTNSTSMNFKTRIKLFEITLK